MTSKEVLAIAAALLSFLATTTTAHRSRNPYQILTISVILSLWTYSGVLSTSPESRGAVLLPLTWMHTVLTNFILALVDIYIIHEKSALKYALLHLATQTLSTAAGAGVLVGVTESDIGFWVAVPYCFALAVFVVGACMRLMLWVWGKLSMETKEGIKSFFSSPLC
jgi:hypothetical protein